MIYENTEKNINDDDNKKELMEPLDYLNNVLVMFVSEQLTLLSLSSNTFPIFRLFLSRE